MTRRVSRFLTVGAIGFVLQLGTLTLLTQAVGWPYEPATALAVALAVLHNFWWHERWTWRDRTATGPRARRTDRTVLRDDRRDVNRRQPGHDCHRRRAVRLQPDRGECRRSSRKQPRELLHFRSVGFRPPDGSGHSGSLHDTRTGVGRGARTRNRGRLECVRSGDRTSSEHGG